MNRMTVLILFMLTFVVSGCGVAPEDVATEFQNAINSQDTEAVMGLLADEVVLQVEGTQISTGKREIQNWLESQAGLNFQFEGTPVSTDSGVSFDACMISSDIWSYFGLGSMTGTCEIALAEDNIISFVVQFDENSKGRLSESVAAVSADMIGIWITRNYLTDSGDLYLEFVEGGTGRLMGLPVDSTPDPDPDAKFEGASLKWTYENYILTIQNEGPASEKYCQEQDVGSYLVKMADGGGLQFKRLNDTCSLRELAFKLPPRWRPMMP